MPGRKLSPREFAYLQKLDEAGLTKEERIALHTLNVRMPDNPQRQLEMYEKALEKRMKLILDDGLHPREVLRRKRPSILERFT